MIEDVDNTIIFTKTYNVEFNNNYDYYYNILNAINNLYYIAPNFDIRVLSHLCVIADADGVAMFNSRIRKDIISLLQCSTQSFSNAINRLKTLNLINGFGGTYKLSPHFMFGGSKKDRDKILSGDVRIILNFNIKK